MTISLESRRLRRKPFEEGETILIVDHMGKQHLLRLQSGLLTHHGRAGKISHDAIIGRPAGLSFLTPDGHEFVCVRPTLEDFLLKSIKRHTQIIYPKDLGTILIQGDIYPGARVLEAGMGSGALALTLRRFLGPEGELVSYEKREEFALAAQTTFEEFGSRYGEGACRHRVEIRDVYEGIDEDDLDTVILDVPEPQLAARHAAAALRPNGVLLSWLPTALQVFELVRHLQEAAEWSRIRTTESLVRPWHVSSQSLRPAQRMVAHTGFLVCALKTVRIDETTGAAG